MTVHRERHRGRSLASSDQDGAPPRRRRQASGYALKGVGCPDRCRECGPKQLFRSELHTFCHPILQTWTPAVNYPTATCDFPQVHESAARIYSYGATNKKMEIT